MLLSVREQLKFGYPIPSFSCHRFEACRCSHARGLDLRPTKPLLAITINSYISSCPKASLFELNSYSNRLSVPIPEVLKDLKVDKDFLQANFILELCMILVVSSSCNLYDVVLPFHAAIS